MSQSLYEYVSEETMILCNFNYDSSQPFNKNNKEYRVFLNMPIDSFMLLIIVENNKNPIWYYRKIPNISQGGDGLGIQENKYSKFVDGTISDEYKINPRDLEGRLLQEAKSLD